MHAELKKKKKHLLLLWLRKTINVLMFTARTARFSKKSPWSVIFRGEMSVICHKITVKCR